MASPLASSGHRAVEQRDDPRGGDGQALAAQRFLVAAFVQRAGVGVTLQQPPVIVAHVELQAGAAEQRRDRIGGGEAGELQDALVHRGEGDERRTVRAGHVDRHADGLPRGRLAWAADRHAQGVGGGVGGDPGQADGAHRIVRVRRGGQRPVRRGQHMYAGPQASEAAPRSSPLRPAGRGGESPARCRRSRSLLAPRRRTGRGDAPARSGRAPGPGGRW